MRYLALLALMVSSAVAAQSAPRGSPEQKALHDRIQASLAQTERKLSAEAGFRPLETLVAEGRTVRRALFMFPYMSRVTHAVEIEREADGSVSLTMTESGAFRSRVELPASAWERLITLQGTLFRAKPYMPWDPPEIVQTGVPAPTCHGWVVVFGAADVGISGNGQWSSCSTVGADQGARAYAIEIARLAVSTRPACKAEEPDPLSAFQMCFDRPQR